ncbi:putative UDP-N-acetylmuramoylalanine-D-glutamate ligase [Microbacterium sp. TS-1]|uniref:hypothetical protein n=1 Tax=Microbacterium sp. TS-1 TaxID=1344956 RepID=UPI00038F33C8|nr:hypothetical protein [Microbacterium sp. TS-1]GAD35037.1 putative UDP-N-acetylmuramoylalanine-D-glutamate ligase [Microbacterium sp. TS-1]
MSQQDTNESSSWFSRPSTRRETLLAGASILAVGGVGAAIGSPLAQSTPGAGAPSVTVDPGGGWGVYVASDGDDGNGGITRDTPVLSISRAVAILGAQAGVIYLKPGDTIQLANTLKIDVSLHRIVGERTVIDATGLSPADTAVQLFSSMVQPLFQPWQILTGVRLRGPGRSTGSVGIEMSNPTVEGKSAVAHIMLSNVAVEGFGTGVAIGSNAYCVTLLNCMIGKSGTCLLVREDTFNSGERIELLSSTVFDSEVGIEIRSRSAEVFVIGTSVDYCDVLIRATEGRAHVVASHLEYNKSTETVPIQVSGTTGGVAMQLGKITAVGKSGPAATPYILSNDSSAVAGSIFENVWMTNLSTTTEYFASGKGYTSVRGELTEGVKYRSFTVVSESSNLLADGNFKKDVVVDDWFFIQGDVVRAPGKSEGFSVRQIGKARCLEIRKQSSRSLEVGLAVPMGRGEIPRVRLEYGFSDQSSGGVASFEAAVLRGGTHQVVRSESIGPSTRLKPHGDSDWTVLRSPLPVSRLPEWATHLVVRFELDDLHSGESLRVREAVVSAT